MSTLKPLQLAIEMSERQRDEVARGLALALNNQAGAQSQMDMLETYARETEAKGLARGQVLTSREVLRHHYQFMGKLDQAIAFQQGVIQSHVERVAQVRQALMAAEQKLARFKHLLAARQADIAKEQSRREQKMSDEFSSRQVSLNRRRFDAEEVT